MDKHELLLRTKSFAHHCVKVALALPQTVLGRHISGQLIRAGTSVAANYRAVCLAQSHVSFISKLSIVLEETDQSRFWMEFAADEGIIGAKKIEALMQEGGELVAIFTAARKTAQVRTRKRTGQEKLTINN